MGTYINSKGQAVDTREMATPHLQRALDKAQRENHENNIIALEEELLIRVNE